MYQKEFYKTIDREKISEYVMKEGFNPILIINKPGFVYSEHKHPETKLLVFLEGNVKVIVDGEKYHCLPGDKLIVPANTTHSAIVGGEGCSFFWSEKIL
ncbi:MAG TPA: cupin domain-containing protein [Candidatus Limnocylindrales bacterium]|nr:cupin domain-containing protein [Candidatus Limnocylindrales bacterium]